MFGQHLAVRFVDDCTAKIVLCKGHACRVGARPGEANWLAARRKTCSPSACSLNVDRASDSTCCQTAFRLCRMPRVKKRESQGRLQSPMRQELCL